MVERETIGTTARLGCVSIARGSAVGVGGLNAVLGQSIAAVTFAIVLGSGVGEALAEAELRA